jgi:hypothetical protein
MPTTLSGAMQRDDAQQRKVSDTQAPLTGSTASASERVVSPMAGTDESSGSSGSSGQQPVHRLPRTRVFYQAKVAPVVGVQDGHVQEIVDQFERLHDWKKYYDASDLRGNMNVTCYVPLDDDDGDGDDEDDDDDNESAEHIAVDSTFYTASGALRAGDGGGRRTYGGILVNDGRHPFTGGRGNLGRTWTNGRDVHVPARLHPMADEEHGGEHALLRQLTVYPDGPPASGNAEAKFWLNSKEATFLSDDEYASTDDDDDDDARMRSPESPLPSASFCFTLEDRRNADATRADRLDTDAAPIPDTPTKSHARRQLLISARRPGLGHGLRRQKQQAAATQPPEQAPRALSAMTATEAMAAPPSPRQKSEVPDTSAYARYGYDDEEDRAKSPMPRLKVSPISPVVNSASAPTTGVRGVPPQMCGTRPAASAALRKPVQEAAAKAAAQRKCKALALARETDTVSLVDRIRNRRARARRAAAAPQPRVVSVGAAGALKTPRHS